MRLCDWVMDNGIELSFGFAIVVLLVLTVASAVCNANACEKACAPQKVHTTQSSMCACEAEGRELRMVRP